MIKFFDKTTGGRPKSSSDSDDEFYIDQNGDVVEFIYQSYANFSAMMPRSDVGWIIERDLK